jgi:hypothetical protein
VYTHSHTPSIKKPRRGKQVAAPQIWKSGDSGIWGQVRHPPCLTALQTSTAATASQARIKGRTLTLGQLREPFLTAKSRSGLGRGRDHRGKRCGDIGRYLRRFHRINVAIAPHTNNKTMAIGSGTDVASLVP